MPLGQAKPASVAAEGDLCGSSIMQRSSTTESTENNATKKRKRPDADFEEFKEEIMLMFTKMKEEQEKSFAMILDTVNAIKDQNKEISQAIDFFSSKYDDLIARINTLEDEKTQYQKQIQSLEYKLDIMDRRKVASCIELRNVPFKKPETKEELLSLTKKIGDTVNINIEQSDIRDIYRFNKNSTINIQFTSIIKKDNFLKAVHIFNQKNKEKLNTTHLQISGAPLPVYISQKLTYRDYKVFAETRKFAKNNDFRFCWTSNGKIYLRKTEGATLIHIKSEDDLSKLKPA
ncbi:uncharacterized protein LOC121738331 [Aricia agestis]|uniref:uncharacterized protein LOC121738331 n=1 Tax=Aricia agestis TaxID=91739 RepID=UPI001C20A6EC|nr:uncharacterized protein LOC121738331 [Aricia agestis]